MTDRGIIKWQPFNSCFSATNIINEINNQKNRLQFPTLSEDQLNLISEKIIEAYNLKISVNIMYYYDGNQKNIKGVIETINTQQKKICINNLYIYLKQILKITY